MKVETLNTTGLMLVSWDEFEGFAESLKIEDEADIQSIGKMRERFNLFVSIFALAGWDSEGRPVLIEDYAGTLIHPDDSQAALLNKRRSCLYDRSSGDLIVDGTITPKDEHFAKIVDEYALLVKSMIKSGEWFK